MMITAGSRAIPSCKCSSSSTNAVAGNACYFIVIKEEVVQSKSLNAFSESALIKSIIPYRRVRNIDVCCSSLDLMQLTSGMQGDPSGFLT